MRTAAAPLKNQANVAPQQRAEMLQHVAQQKPQQNAGYRPKPKQNPAPFPWDEVIGFCLSKLHLAPEAYWALTPCEIAASLRFLSGKTGAPLESAAFAALQAAFPDVAANNTAQQSIKYSML